MVGEMGESHHAIRMMGEYTSGKRLRKSYSFVRCSATASTPAFPRPDRGVLRRRAEGLADLGLLEPRRPRHVTAGRSTASGRPLAKLAGRCCPARGLDLHLPGRGLGQTETELELFELTDPQGHPLLARAHRRTAARTPMVWDASRANAGFTTGRPWLPVKEAQAAQAVARPDGERSRCSPLPTMLKLRRETEATPYRTHPLLRRGRARPRLHPRRQRALHL